MEIARIEVGRTTGACTRRGRIPAGIVGASVQVSFTDPVWHNLIKTVVFRAKETRIAEFDGAVAVIPHEVVAEPGVTLYFGIFGHDPDSDLQIPLIEVRLGITEAATDANADPGTDPTLPIWAQLQQEIEEIKQQGPGSGGGNVVPVETAYGTTIILNDSTDKSLQGLKIYGKTFQNGTPTPESPVELVSPGDDGSLTVTIGVSLDDTVPQTISISTPNGMPGIPVTSGGNYTDTSGQQWICDEVDFAKGVYIQRIVRYVFKGTEPFQRSTYTYWVPLSDIGLSLANVKAALCNWYTFTLTNANAAQTPGVFDFYCPAPDFITPNQVRMSTDGFDTVGAFKTALSEAYEAANPMYCLFALSEPVETALTEDELTAYANMHTNFPSTAIANDGFANMEVSYKAIGNVKKHEFRDYLNYGIPVLSLSGDATDMTKDNAVTMYYEFQGRNGQCTVKWQGTSSLAYPKKNYTIKFDTAFEAKEGWGEQSKYCLKANFIDATHARNIVSARLWSRLVGTRDDGLFSTLPQHGAIDGFPIVVEINGKFSGLYTFNIPKDGWLFGLSNSSLTQSATVSTPNGLPGIPVSSGGNYTDENGQQWICDELDFEKGIYTQRIVRYIFNGTEPFQASTYSNWVPLSDLKLSLAKVKASLCNWFEFTTNSVNSGQTNSKFDFFYSSSDWITPQQIRFANGHFPTVSEFKTALKEAYEAANPMYCLFALDTPVETALTEAELTAYTALHTIYPSTAIVNDGFANMEVSYMAISDVSPIEISAYGTTIILNDSADKSLQGLKIYGKTFQNGTPTPESPVELVSPGDDGSLTVTIGVSLDDTVPQAVVCAEISTSQASGFWAEAKLDESDFSLEYVSSKNNADWVKTSLNRLITACMNSDGTDLDTTVGRYLDWNSAIDYYIFNVLIGGYDCVRKNYILVTLDGKKWYFSAYDMDSTFGLKWTGKGFLYSRDAEPTPSIYSVRHKVMQLIATYKKDELKARYEYIQKNVLPEYVVHGDFYNFSYEIPKIVLEEDWRKWPSIPNTHGSTIAQILDWYRTRIEYMDAEMEAL